MQRPDIKDYDLNIANSPTISYPDYCKALEKHIDHLESLPLKTEGELRELLADILTEANADSFDITYNKILSLFQKPGIKFPTDEEIVNNFPTEMGNKIRMEDETSYGQMLTNNFQRIKGANWMKEQIKKLNNIS